MSQTNPFKALHASLPHAHATEFSSDPSVLEQVSPRLHVLGVVILTANMSQYKPELGEHADVPHRHGEVLEIVPSVSSHVGAEMQMHSYTFLEHDLVEEGAVLKYRLPLYV